MLVHPCFCLSPKTHLEQIVMTLEWIRLLTKIIYLHKDVTTKGFLYTSLSFSSRVDLDNKAVKLPLKRRQNYSYKLLNEY